MSKGTSANSTKNFARNERVRRAISFSLNLDERNTCVQHTILHETVSCFGRCLLLHSETFRSQDTLQPTHKHFYKHGQNSYRDRPNYEFRIIEDGDPIYNVVAIPSTADERGQGGRRHDLHRRGTNARRDKRSDKWSLYLCGDLPGCHPHSFRSVDCSRIDTANASIRIDQDWRDA